jgi:hypothetical protein
MALLLVAAVVAAVFQVASMVVAAVANILVVYVLNVGVRLAVP